MTLDQLHSVGCAVTALGSILLGWFVWRAGPDALPSRRWAQFCLVVAGWALSISLSFVTARPDLALALARAGCAFAVMIPYRFLRFVVSYVGTTAHHVAVRWLGGVTMVLAVLAFSPWFVTGFRATPGFVSGFIAPGLLYYLFAAMFAAQLSYALAWLIRAHGQSDGARRTHIRYIVVASTIGFVGGFTYLLNDLGIAVPPLPALFIWAYSALVGYAICRHRLLGIRVVVRKSVVYSALVSVLTLIYFAVVFIGERSVQQAMGYRSLLVSVVAFLGMGLIFEPLKRWLQRRVDRWLLPEPKEVLARRLELLEQEVREADKARAISHLAAGIAHEIKNPLTALRTFTDALPARQADAAFLEQFQQVVSRELDRLHGLAQGLVDFAKPHVAARQPVECQQVLDHVMTLTRGDLQARGITVAVHAHHDGARLVGDAGQLSQVFLNLILNARDAMAQGGTLPIATQARDHAVEIVIADTGQGIAPADLPHLFDPFFTRKAHGSGSGLSIVQRIVQEHGGTIAVDSRLGQGTTFTIRLPQ